MADFDEQMRGALLLGEHHIDLDSARRSPDNLSACVCGRWSDGPMEPGWDDHLIEVLWEAGWRPPKPHESDAS